MARMFIADPEHGWYPAPLESGRWQLDRRGIVRLEGAETSAPGAVLLLQADDHESGWVVLAGAGARVHRNGEPLALGMAVLRDRDELRLEGAAPCYFSTERLAEIESCPRDDAPRCPRCAQAIERGSDCVQCPACLVRHHQADERPCWTYAPTCALCDQATALDAGLRWSPEEL